MCYWWVIGIIALAIMVAYLASREKQINNGE